MIAPGQQSIQLFAPLYSLQPSGEEKDLPEVSVSISVPMPLISIEEYSKR